MTYTTHREELTMAEPKYIIHLAQGNLPTPAVPLGVDEDLRIVSGVSPDDFGAQLVGFAQPGVDGPLIAGPTGLTQGNLVEGFVPVLSNRGMFFGWGLAVELIEIVEPTPEPEPEVSDD